MNPLVALEALAEVRGVRRVTLLRGERLLGRLGPAEEGDVPDRLRREQLERLAALGSPLVAGGARSACAFLGSEVHQLVRVRGYTLHVVLGGAMLLTGSLVPLLEAAGEGGWSDGDAGADGAGRGWDARLARKRAMEAARALVDKVKVVEVGDAGDGPEDAEVRDAA